MADISNNISRQAKNGLEDNIEVMNKALGGLTSGLTTLGDLIAHNADQKRKRDAEEKKAHDERMAGIEAEKTANDKFGEMNKREQRKELKRQNKQGKLAEERIKKELEALRLTTANSEEEEKLHKKLISQKKRELSIQREENKAKKDLVKEYALSARAISKVKKQWDELADTRIGKGFSAINKGLGVILGASGAAAGLISVLNSSDKAFVNIAKAAGISVSANGQMSKDFQASSKALTRMGYSLEEIGGIGVAAINAMGGAATVTQQSMEFIGASAKTFGMSIEDSAGAFKTLSITMGLGADHTERFANTLKNEATAAGVSASLVFRDMSNFAAKTTESFGMTPQQLKNAAIRARQLGTSLEEIAGVSKNFTTMESSLEITQKAGLLFGAQMNAFELTRLARSGQIEKVQDRILSSVRKQVDANGDIHISDVAQAELLEKMLGKDWKNIIKARHMERKIQQQGIKGEEEKAAALQIAMRDTKKWNKMSDKERKAAIKNQLLQQKNSEGLNEAAEEYQSMWARVKSLFLQYIIPHMTKLSRWISGATQQGGILQKLFSKIEVHLAAAGVVLEEMSKTNEFETMLKGAESVLGFIWRRMVDIKDLILWASENEWYTNLALALGGAATYKVAGKAVNAALGKIGLGSNDGSTPNTALWVRLSGSMLDALGLGGQGGGQGGKPGGKPGGGAGGGIWARMRNMVGAGRDIFRFSREDGLGRRQSLARATRAPREALGNWMSKLGGGAGPGGAGGMNFLGSARQMLGTGMKWAGTAAKIYEVGDAIKTFADKDATAEDKVGKGGRLAGMFAGAKLGTTIGAMPAASGAGAAIAPFTMAAGGLIGGILGAIYGEEASKGVYTWWDDEGKDLLAKDWKKITKEASQLWQFFARDWDRTVNDIEEIWSSVGDVFEYIGDGFESAFRRLADIYTSIRNKWNSLPFVGGDKEENGTPSTAAPRSDSSKSSPSKQPPMSSMQYPTSVSELDVGGRSAQQLADDYGVDISQGAYGFSANQIRNMDPQKIKDYLQKNGIESLDQMSKTQMGKMFLLGQMGKFNVSKNAKGGKYGGDIKPKRTNDMGEKVNGAQLALVGEENKDEVIIPTQRIREGKPINAEVAEELQSIGVPGFMRGRRSMTRGGASNAAAQVSLQRSALALETSASDIKAQESLMRDAIEHSTEVADAQFNHMQTMWEEEEEREKAKEPFDWSLLEVMGAHLVAAEGVINTNAELLQGWGTVGNWLVDNSRLIGDVGRFLMAKDKKEAAIQIALQALTTKIMESMGGSDGADAGRLFAANMANGMKPMNAALSSMSSVFDRDRQSREALNAKIEAAQAKEAQLTYQAAQLGLEGDQANAFVADQMDETSKRFVDLKKIEAEGNVKLAAAAGEFATGTLAMIEGGMSLKKAAKQQGIIMLKQHALRKIEHLFSKTEFSWEKAKVLWQKIFQAKEQVIQAKEMAIQTQKGASSILSGGAQAAGAAGTAGAGAAAAGGTAASGGLAAALAPLLVPLLIIVAVIAALYLIIKYWDKITAAIGWVVKQLGKVIKGIFNFLKSVTKKIEKILNAIKNFVGQLISAVYGVIKSLVRAIVAIPKSIWKGIKSIFSAMKKAIPFLSSGGVYSSPTMAMIGETNEKEVVVPVERIRNGGEVNPAVMAEMNALGPYLGGTGSSNKNTDNGGGSNEALINEIRALRAEIAAVANRPISISMDGKKVADVVGERFNRMANNY